MLAELFFFFFLSCFTFSSRVLLCTGTRERLCEVISNLNPKQFSSALTHLKQRSLKREEKQKKRHLCPWHSKLEPQLLVCGNKEKKGIQREDLLQMERMLSTIKETPLSTQRPATVQASSPAELQPTGSACREAENPVGVIQPSWDQPSTVPVYIFHFSLPPHVSASCSSTGVMSRCGVARRARDGGGGGCRKNEKNKGAPHSSALAEDC